MANRHSTEHKRILLTGGRAPATLDLARQFARAGHSVFVAESSPLHLCLSSKWISKNYSVPAPNSERTAFIDALLHIIYTEQIDLLIPTCEEIFFVAQGLAQLCEHCTVFVSPLEQLRRVHSKWDFIQCARLHGLPVPQTWLLTSPGDWDDFCQHHAPPYVLKPVFSRFATRVQIIKPPYQFHADELPFSKEDPWVAQEYISGQLFCSYSIAHTGKLLAHTVYPETFTAGQGACIHFQAIDHPAIKGWVTHFLEQEHFSGQIAFDFMVTASGTVYPLECNPRATSGVHLFRTEDRLDRAFFGACDALLTPHPGTQRMLCLAMLFCGLPTIRTRSQMIHWLRLFFGARDVIFALDDPKPFFAQIAVLGFNWWQSRRKHLSIPAFSTLDIEWNGQE